MPHDGPPLTGAPDPLVVTRQPHIVAGPSVGFPYFTNAQADSVVSYADAAAGGGTVSHASSSGNTPAAFRAGPPDHFDYNQALWTIPVSAIRTSNHEQIYDPFPPDWATASLDPRLIQWTWDSLVLATIRWSPYGMRGFAVTASGGGDLASVVAHGYAFSYWSAAVDLSTPAAPQLTYLPASSLPAADWTWAPAAGDFSAASSTEYRTPAWFNPDLGAGDGVPVPVADFDDDGDTVGNRYVLAYPLWQTVPGGPPENESYQLNYLVDATGDPVMALRITYDPASAYRYSYYDGPTSPAPVTFDIFGDVGWAAASSDQGSLDHYLVEVLDVTHSTIDSSTTVSAGSTSYSVPGFSPVSGVTYQARVTAYDSIGPGPSALSPTVSGGGPNGDAKIELPVVATARAAAVVSPAVSADPVGP